MRDKAHKQGTLSLPLDFSPGDPRSAERDRAQCRDGAVQAEGGAEARTAERPAEEVPLSVSELLGYVSGSLRAEYADVLVLGELTSFKSHASGHCYFALADEGGCVDAVMWRSQAGRLTFEPRVGDQVVCRGYLDVYPKQGRMQLYVQAMRPVGAGAAQRALEELKRKLQAEGLFDPARKRALPFYPRTIGVVTSRTGAAVHDIFTTLRRRCRRCRVVLSPAAVQGPEAPRELLAALRALARLGACDVVILGRGGGAAEDLSAFNDEALVREVAAFPVPIVSAVGHEIDFTLCDFAADHRAATPTAAAEMVVPVYSDLEEDVGVLARRLHGASRRYVDHLRHRLGNLAGKLRDPQRTLAAGRQRTDELFVRMERALIGRHRRSATALLRTDERLRRVGRARAGEAARAVAQLETRLQRGTVRRASSARTEYVALCAKLEALSPLAVLDRGYSLAARADGRLVRSAADLAVGDELSLRFHEGHATARVLSTRGARNEPDPE